MQQLRLPAFLLASLLFSCPLSADESTQVAFWDFGPEESTPLQRHGNVSRDEAGPRPPEFPDFAADNTAVRMQADGYFSFSDTGTASDFDFTNGDAISLEAWVRLESPQNGQPMYVIGKGRTGTAGFARDNQNWALRVVSMKGTVRVSFLFATPTPAGSGHWHRWTSETGFLARTGWHHIAVSYRFGEPDSVRGWIDGQPTAGTWDMGGATTQAPVVDDDEIWIGSAQQGNPGNSFRGWMDRVAVHRGVLSDSEVAKRFTRVGGPQLVSPQPPVMPDMGEIPSGKVLVTISEAFPNGDRWPFVGEEWPTESTRFLTNQFLLHRLPVAYDEWGIRRAWNAPLLIRVAADVQLDHDRYEFMVRTRSLSRLWLNGELVLNTPAGRRRTGNLEAIVPIPIPPVPDGRIAGFVQQEAVSDFEVLQQPGDDRASQRVIFEFVVGGNGQRTETGEVCVAIRRHKTDWYAVLQPAGHDRLPLINSAVDSALQGLEQTLVSLEDRTRREQASSLDEFWQRRHDHARNVVSGQTADQQVADHNHIDALIARKIEIAKRATAAVDETATRRFHEDILPLLTTHCLRCHGEKSQGGLRLDTQQHALGSGDSEQPAIVPGDPARSELLVRVRAGEMPPSGTGLTTAEVTRLEEWIRDGAQWPAIPLPSEVAAQPVRLNDAAFLRRAYLDTTGVPPDFDTVSAFLNDKDAAKRARVVDDLLSDERFADHWVSFWMDLLAENPTLLNASLNSTGPFRWFLYESLRDHKPLDRMVTELILMRGGPHAGGSAGFALAAENDAPMAAKAHIVSSAFLGIEMQCARCHDSPYHSTTQADLYAAAAMLSRKAVAPPVTSRVPEEFFESKGRASLIQVTLPLGEAVAPEWPFAEFTAVENDQHIDDLMMNPEDSRERFAALITTPENRRFPRVVVNHLWKRLIGAGFVEPVHDWEGRTPSHPQLLSFLADELVAHNYDMRHVIRLIMNSRTYNSTAVGHNLAATAEQRFFNVPDPRRMSAEQVVDSLFHATGRSIDVEELTFVHDGSQPVSKRMTLGRPRRAWMFASLNNERDRPSLSLPRAQPVVDVLEAFGWTGSRQKPIPTRDTDPNVLQPGILANGTLTQTLSRAAIDTRLADLAVDAESPTQLLQTLFLRFLSRYPTAEETAEFLPALQAGFETRLVPADQQQVPGYLPQLPQVTWTNHLVPEANEIQLEIQRRVLQGPAADPRLRTEWREVYEDVVWSLINHHEFVWLP